METERSDLIDQYFAMLRKLSDRSDDILEVRKFFEKLTEVRGFVPPTVEFMIVLKTYKPRLFQEFRALLIPNSRMQLLSTVNFDIGQALVNLGITDQTQLYRAIKGI